MASPSSEGRPRERLRETLRATGALVVRADRRAFDAVVSRRNPALDAILVPAAHTGAGGVPWLGLALVIHRRARHGRRLGVVRAGATVLTAFAAARAVKLLTRRTRPCDGREEVALVDCPGSSSLPSDQAASAFAGAAAISAALPRLAPRVYGAAAVTAFSRVYTGVHYPSDVAVGALLGAAVGRLFGRPSVR